MAMFNKNSKSDTATTASINLIGNGTNITGDISSNGDVRIDGTLNGNITISGKLVIGVSGRIDGTVQCQNADISGEINGTIGVSDLLVLKASAKVIGDIVTGKISIEPNAVFTGTCKMGAIVKPITQSDAGQQGQQASKTA